jgi:hypothetical protein
VASITAAKRSSAAKKSPPKLPYEKTYEELAAISRSEMKLHFAPKKLPPKQYIPPHTVRHFAKTRAKPTELAIDYDCALTRSSRADFEQSMEVNQQKGKQLTSSENRKTNFNPPWSCTPMMIRRRHEWSHGWLKNLVQPLNKKVTSPRMISQTYTHTCSLSSNLTSFRIYKHKCEN